MWTGTFKFEDNIQSPNIDMKKLETLPEIKANEKEELLDNERV